jgi:hypothetical protein
MNNNRTIALSSGVISVALSSLLIFTGTERLWAEEPAPGVSSITASPPALRNGDFEDGDVDAEPTEWTVPPIPGFKVMLTDDNPLVGKQCAVIRRAGGSEGPFGNLVQRVAAEPFRAKRVRFRAGVRAEVEGRPNQAQLWLRVDRLTPDGQRAMGAFDNMGDRPITATEWNYYEIVADVAKDAEQISVGMLLVGQGEAWIDDASFEVVGADVPLTPGARRSGKSLDELKPGLFEIVGGMRIAPTPNIAHKIVGMLKETRAPEERDHVLIPLPLAYRDQVPLNFELTVAPPRAIDAVEIYQDGPDNYVLKAQFADKETWEHVDIAFKSMVIVGPSDFSGAPAKADIPDVWPVEAQPWLAATWCVDAKHERIKAIGEEIRSTTSDVPEIVRLVLKRAGQAFGSAQGQATAMTAVQALDKRGSCTSCANLVAALLRASGVPARIVAGYPSWSGPLQTHYIVEAYMPEYGWYPIESTQCQSPWPNTHQVNVAIIPPQHEEKAKAGFRLGIGAGVPYLSLTEMPVNHASLASRGTIETASGCDHQCRVIRALQGTPEEWDQAIQSGTSRWENWCAAEHGMDQDGRIAFGPPLHESVAETVAQVMQDVDGQ